MKFKKNAIFISVGLICLLSLIIFAGKTQKPGEIQGPTLKGIYVNNKICPVSGEEIGSMGSATYAEYKGKVYSLCCFSCEEYFKLDPEKYISQLNSSEKQ